MSLPTRTVTGTFTGRPAASVLFRLLNTVSDGTTVVEAGTQTVSTLDGTGNLSQALLCQDPSLNADPVYDWRPIFGNAEWVRGVVVPAGAGSVALASLSTVGTPLTPTQFTTLDDAIATETTRATAAETAGTAALTTHKSSTDHDSHNDGRYDALGAASTVQAAAASDATAKVATETSRATTAEALKAPLASPALTGTPTVNGATVEDRTHAAGAYETVGRKSLAVYDEFSRYADGALSGTPLVGAAWVTSGANLPAVASGLVGSTGTGYLYQTLASKPAVVSCEVVWSGSGAGSAMTMAVTDTSANVNNLCPHFNFGPNGFLVTCRRDGGTFDTLLSGTWREPMPLDGATRCRVTMRLRGDALVIIGPNGEDYSTTDKRMSAFTGTAVFWEPNTSGSTVAKLASVAVVAEAATGRLSPLDTAGIQGGGGWVQGPTRQVVGGRNTAYEVMAGYEPVAGLPGLTFGPSTILTYLTSDAAIGATTILVNDTIVGSTGVQIDSGANSETIAQSGNPTGTGPYTITLASALTKAHAAGTAVAAAIPASKRTTIYWNPTNQFLQLPTQTFVNGFLYIGSNLDVNVGRAGAGVLSIGQGFRVTRKTQTLASNGAVTIDASQGGINEVTLNANATSSSITNGLSGQDLTVAFIQDATGGRTYSWPANCKFAGGSAPSDTTASKRTIVNFYYDGTNWYERARSVAVG